MAKTFKDRKGYEPIKGARSGGYPRRRCNAKGHKSCGYCFSSLTIRNRRIESKAKETE